MNDHTLLHTLAGACADARIPDQADVLLLQTPTQEQLRARTRRFVAQLVEHGDCPRDNGGTWQQRDDHTVIHLPDGARAMVYHASGALRYVSGLAPAERPFGREAERDILQRLVEESAHKLALSDWAGANGELRFERLFRTRGQGADPTGKASATTLFRALGAWRQYAGGIPVLGAASAALRLAGDGRLDTLSVQMRPANGEVLDRAAIIEPQRGARQIVAQLGALLGQREIAGGLVEAATLQFGYLDLGKRKAQRVLAPAYVARIVLRHKTVRQAYVLAVRATERAYLELPVYGAEVVAGHGRTDIARCEAALR
ncbi:hypothetical protein [Massilia luteola]|uniref:hypothetical protein n=1 Tax=Massilia luteola TaxID=3081751 RepID=UPI002ACC00E8|nr:hypothetical protein [Massilia sp. Gc5]